MIRPRDYDITIRNELDAYIGRGVKDHNYAKMSSSETDGSEGKVTVRIGSGSIVLTSQEAREVARTIEAAAQGATSHPYFLAIIHDMYGRDLSVTSEILRNGGKPISLSRAFRDTAEFERLEAALQAAHPIENETGYGDRTGTETP